MKTLLDYRDTKTVEKFEKERARHRRRNHRITYDCRNTQCKGERVFCTRGKILQNLSADGSIYNVFVIRGRTSFACKTCSWFIPSENPD